MQEFLSETPMLNFSDEKYKEIIDLPHHEPTTQPRMSMTDRAAQFSPFAALTGYGDAVAETARDNEKQFSDR